MIFIFPDDTFPDAIRFEASHVVYPRSAIHTSMYFIDENSDKADHFINVRSDYFVVKSMNEDWWIVPFRDMYSFPDVAIFTPLGAISPNVIFTDGFAAGFLHPGLYRVVRSVVWFEADFSRGFIEMVPPATWRGYIWAEFTVE